MPAHATRARPASGWRRRARPLLEPAGNRTWSVRSVSLSPCVLEGLSRMRRSDDHGGEPAHGDPFSGGDAGDSTRVTPRLLARLVANGPAWLRTADVM